MPKRITVCLLLLELIANASAQGFAYRTNNGAIEIIQYTGPGGDVAIPAVINGLPVTKIGSRAFLYCFTLTAVTISKSVTIIDTAAFYGCKHLTNATILGSGASIRDFAFFACTNLTSVYFQGNAPTVGSNSFFAATAATAYYLPGTTGWGSTLDGRPTAPWCLPSPAILTLPPDFGLHTNHFAFRISWATNASVVVETSPTLATPAWSPIATNTITMGTEPFTDGWADFTDPEPATNPARFYRLRSP